MATVFSREIRPSRARYQTARRRIARFDVEQLAHLGVRIVDTGSAAKWCRSVRRHLAHAHALLARPGVLPVKGRRVGQRAAFAELVVAGAQLLLLLHAIITKEGRARGWKGTKKPTSSFNDLKSNLLNFITLFFVNVSSSWFVLLFIMTCKAIPDNRSKLSTMFYLSTKGNCIKNAIKKKKIKRKEKQFGAKTAIAKVAGTKIAGAETACAETTECQLTSAQATAPKMRRRNEATGICLSVLFMIFNTSLSLEKSLCDSHMNTLSDNAYCVYATCTLYLHHIWFRMLSKCFERCALQSYCLVQGKEKWVGYNAM
uniref:Uncharacterized protein n=1 Tax=Romanomermis culicivorax TaxID=13658 RepID=A0A915K8J2_ROMCU